MNREPKKALSMPGNFPVSLDDEEGPEYWQNHVDSWHRSGLSQAAYCRKHGMAYNRFRKWKVHLSTYPSTGTSIKLVEVKRDFTLNRNAGSYPPPPFCGPGFNSSSDCVCGSYPGYAGLHRAGTGGSSGIRFWCGEFCIEVDVKFSSDTLRQLLQTLQGVYVKNDGDAADAGEE